MPTYEYECLKCGNRFDVFQRITDPPRKRCGACRGSVRRVIGAGAGILFKGKGFYTTDYRSESYRKAQKAENQKETPAGKSKPADAAGGKDAGSKPSAATS